MDFKSLSTFKPKKKHSSKDIGIKHKESINNKSNKLSLSEDEPKNSEECIEECISLSKRKCLHLDSPVGTSNNTSKRINLNSNISSRYLNKPDVDLLQDTFMCFDDTQTLINKSRNLPNKGNETTFSQMCDTQVLKKIDNDIHNSNKIKTESHDKSYDKSMQDISLAEFQNLDDEFSFMKQDLFITTAVEVKEELRRFKKQLFNKEYDESVLSDETHLKDKEIEEQMVNLFKTSHYRKEVEMLFEKVEYSILDLGPNQDQILTKDLLQNSLPTNLDSNLEQVINETLTRKDDSMLSKVVLSPQNEKAFGSIIRKVLLENAKKAVTPGKIMNETLVPHEPSYSKLGNFYDLPDKVKDLIKTYKGIENLYDWQHECLSLSAIKNRKNLVFALPTSGGKTLVAEILILREILCWKRNVLFILPYVAIVQEKVWALSPFAVALEFLVEEYAAGKGNFPPRKRRRKNSVYVATIEKALGLVNSLIDTGRLGELGLIVVDELHLVGDQSRGGALEEVLNKLQCIQENIQIIGMSATIGNLCEICKFLNAEVYTQNFRPVELTEYIKCGNELAKINWKAKDENDLFILEKKCDFSYSEKLNKIDPDHLGGLVMEVIPNDSCLIFCSTKKNCENVAYLLCRVISPQLREVQAKEKNDLTKALEQESGSLCDILKTSIPFGVAYHHSGLTSDERRLIEEGFRTGILSVICCTSTLAAGVNLPAKRVILRQPYIGKELINLSRYKQMVGRAGRAGLGSSGESIIICTSQDLPKMRELFLSPMDEALSSLHQNGAIGLRQLLLSCISLNIATTRPDLLKIAKRTLLAVQESKLEVHLKKLIDKALIELFKLGALKVDDLSTQESVQSNADVSVRMNTSNSVDLTQSTTSTVTSVESKKTKIHVTLNNTTKLVISKLGTAAIKGGLELTVAHMLYDDLLQAQASLVLLNCLHLLYLVTPYDISERVRPSKLQYYNIYIKLGKAELQTAKILGLTESCAIQLLNNKRIQGVSERVLNRFYVTLILYDLWNEVSIFEVAEKFELQRGLIQNLMTSAASFSSNVVNFCAELTEFWAFAYLLKGMTERLHHCCVKDLLPLMDLPSVKQSRARQLYNAGYKTLALVAKADPNDLIQNIEFMSRRVANQLIAAAKLLLLERVENLREEAEDVMDGIEPNLVNYTIPT